MSSIPLPALQVQPTNVGQAYAQGGMDRLQAVAMRDQNQARQMEMAEMKRQQQATQKLMQDIAAENDYDKGLERYEKTGGDPMLAQKVREGRIKSKAELLEIDEKQRAALRDNLKRKGAAAQALLSIPDENQRAAMYNQVVQQFGIQDAPPQYPGEQMLRFVALTQVDVDKQLDLADKKADRLARAREGDLNRNAPTANEKDFQAWYKAQLEATGQKPNARLEMEARDTYRKQQKERTPVPGVDVPLPPAVEAQRDRMRPEQTVVMQTVDEQGNPIRKIVPKVAGAEYKAGPTSDMRNKEASRQLVGNAINTLEALSRKVVTEKVAVAQRTVAGLRAAAAALSDDPEYRTYQDARMALAGNLAVAQQGSRPSDADIKSIWLPLVPDAFRDTEASAKMKWDLIRVNSGLGTETGQQQQYSQTATDPKTGKKVGWNGTAWVPIS